MSESLDKFGMPIHEEEESNPRDESESLNDHASRLAAVHGTKAETVKWIIEYRAGKVIDPSDEVIQDLEPYRLAKAMTLYRGITGDRAKWPKGEIVEHRWAASSWTKEKNRAQDFGDIILKHQFKPEDTIADFTRLPREIIQATKYHREEEVLIKAGAYQVLVACHATPSSW